MFEKHLYDCPDCLGTGYEEPAKRIMNLELMLNQHKETLKSSDAHNNELAQQLEIAWEQRDRLAEALRQIKSELGVPQPEYPAPIANAVKIADEALAAVEGGSDE